MRNHTNREQKMIRRNITLPAELYAEIRERCRLLEERDGEPISVSAFIRTSVRWALGSIHSPHKITEEG